MYFYFIFVKLDLKQTYAHHQRRLLLALLKYMYTHKKPYIIANSQHVIIILTTVGVAIG
jgi:hypothetical protein